MDKNPKPLNREAKQLVETGLPRLLESEEQLARNLINFTIKIEEAKAQAKIDAINRMKQADEEVRKYLAKGDEIITAYKQKREEFFATLREIQPELHSIEFELDPDEGTYIPVCARKEKASELSDNDEACGLPPMPENMPEDVKRTMTLLMQKITGKPN
jgi:primosomal protein N'